MREAARPAAARAADRPVRPRLRPGRLRAEVILLHAERRDGAPAVKSRWLWRLETLARGAGVDAARPAGGAGLGPRRWTRPTTSAAGRPRPSPRPPVEARPAALSVTRVETWVRDPYADLRPPHPEAARRWTGPTSRSRRGCAARPSTGASSCSRWRIPTPCRPTRPSSWSTLMIEALTEAGMPEARDGPRARRWPRAPAPGSAGVRTRPPPRRRELIVEQRGELTFDADGCAFTVTAKADRIEADGRPRPRARLQDRRRADEEAGAGGLLAAAHPDRRHPARRRLRPSVGARRAGRADLRASSAPAASRSREDLRGRRGGGGGTGRRPRCDGLVAARRQVRPAGHALPRQGRAAVHGRRAATTTTWPASGNGWSSAASEEGE